MPLLRIFANKYSPRSNASAYSTQPASPSSKPLLAPQPSPPSSSATSFSSSPLATPSPSRTAYRRLSLQDIHLLTRILSSSSSADPDDLRMVDKQSSRGSTPKRDTAGGAKMASSEVSDNDGDDGGDKERTPPVSPQLPPSSLSPTTNETTGRIRTRLRIAELPSHLRQCMSPATAATAVAAVRTTATTTPISAFRDRNHGRRRHCRRRRTGIAHRPGCGGHTVRTTPLSSPAYSEQVDEEDGAEEEKDVGGELCTFHTGLDGVLLRSVLAFVWKEAGAWTSGLGLAVVEGDEDNEEAEDDDLRVKEVLALLGRVKGELASWFEDERRTVIATVNAIIGIVLVPVSIDKLSATEHCARKWHCRLFSVLILTSDIPFRADYAFIAWENVVIAPPQRLPRLCPHPRRQRTGAHSGAARLAAGVVPMGAPGEGIEAVGVDGWVAVVGVYARGCG
ncbi:hypothetical protein DIS24_g11134 [Lasiodiplodia hormozganensis]|uniref:Uncharacterized protein n=1 Tax=Lasiodiplodia hormozganensis TaxID=869390 RepID=A0AA40C4X6_9PEZI|nr:hypothetical protein DIS24_g11134 [Lasiodiplodia hormozganensis]